MGGLRIALKPYPACHFTHAFADAALTLINDGLRPEEVERIECLIGQGEIETVCEPVEAKRAPKTEYEAKFSLPFVVAATMVRGRLGLREFGESTLFDPEVTALAAKVSYRADTLSGFPQHYSGELVVTTTDGRVLHVREQINRGAEERPLEDKVVWEKFNDNVMLSRSRAAADRISEALNSIESCRDVSDLAEVFRG